jgi:hypothetical protein
MCKNCQCDCHKIIGPGNDNYGRDFMMADWECPKCHKIFQFTQLDIRLGVFNCPDCDWKSKEAIMWEELIEKIKVKEGLHDS